MKGIQISRLAIAVSMIGLAACDSTSATPSLLSDSTVTTDVAISAGDAIATAIEGMVANEGSASLSVTDANVANTVTNTLTFSRTRTCYNTAGTVVAGCTPLSSVRRIVSHVTADGSRTGNHATTGGTTRTFTGVVHRVSDDTLVRNFNTAQPPAEISRTHSDLTLGNDTTTFTEGDLTRIASEATRDTVKAVTWNLPRSSNPWPVSGSIVRAVTARVVVTRGTRTETRNYTRRVQVTFPADAQGNVVMTVNDRTCNLNLVTRVVSNCT